MSSVVWLGLVILGVLGAYAVLGGADFGGGVWDLLARGPRAEAQRQAIARAMGPVWEANHVWLVFAAVLLFSAFPGAFAALGAAFFAPLHLVLAGIVLRGAAFVFRAHGAAMITEDRASRAATGKAGRGRTDPPMRTWASVFGAASTITPFLLGAALAALSSGGIRVSAGQVRVDVWNSWLSPFALATGALTLALCAYLAAVYLTLETDGALREDFRRRALLSGGAAALLAAGLLPLIAREAPWLWENMRQPHDAPLLLCGALLAAGSVWAVWRRRYRLARLAAAAEVVVLLAGWALAQWPYLVYPDLTAFNSAAPAATIRFMLWTLPFGLLLLIPSLWLLFAVFKGENPAASEPSAEEAGTDLSR